jgi:hypothetical protein
VLAATLPVLPRMAAAFPRTGIPGAIPVPEQVRRGSSERSSGEWSSAEWSKCGWSN